MKRKAVIIVAVVVAAVILVAVIFPLVVNADRFRPTIEARLTTALGRPVHIGHLSFSWLAGGISAENIAVADDPAFATRPFLTAKALDVNVDIWPLLLHREVHINSLAVRQPQVALIRGQGGRWNVSSLGASPTPAAKAPGPTKPEAGAVAGLTLHRFTISNGQITIQQPGSAQTYSDLNLTASNVSPDTTFPFSMTAKMPGQGKLKLDGKAGPAPKGDLAEIPVQANVKVEQLELAAYATRGSALGGTAALTAALRSDGREAHLQGSSTVDKLLLAKGGTPMRQPVALDFATDYNLKAQSGQVTRGDARLGKSLAQLTGGYDLRGSAPALNMKLATQGLQATDVEQLLRALAIALPGGASLQGGAASTTLALNGPADTLVISGPVHVQNVVVSGFNLGSKIRSIATLAGIDTGPDTRLQLFDSKLRMAPEGIRLDEINAVIAGLGTLTGAGTIGADRRLNFHLVAHLSKAGGVVGGLMQAAGVGQLSDVPFRVEGTTANPQFMPELGAIMQTQKTPASGQPQAPQKPLGGVLDQIFKKKK